MIESCDQFISKANRVRNIDLELARDIRYLWWALSEVRGCTAEPMEVLDCSPVCDGLFATLMALRMKPCVANYLYRKIKQRYDGSMVAHHCGVHECVVPILDGRIPQCNPYDVVIIDPVPKGYANADRSLKAVIAGCAWRFTRIFIRHGGQGHLFASTYQSMRKTFKWSQIPHTTIVLGHMSEAWCHSIAPPS